MIYPATIVPGWPLVVTCVRNEFGGTDVTATFLDVALAKVTFRDKDVDVLGFDALSPYITSAFGFQIADALRLAQ